ncbi:MAG: gliding motility-associated C-terminal domain-containing protein, partial [Saprospiraceae bacterium]|nr:gliding motility-associated C-terminal domain-containing protein [Saprospiraceae bacterium]
MMRLWRFSLLIVVVIFTTRLNGQALSQKSYNLQFADQALALETLPNGHLMVAGSTKSTPSGQNSIVLSRLNSAGDVMWTKTVSTGTNAIPADMIKTQDGNLLIVYNNIGSSVGFSTSGWLKVTTDGNVLWAKKSINNAFLTKISPAANGGFFLSGQNITGGSVFTGMTVRLDAQGVIQWSTVFGESGSSAVHDTWEDPQGFVHCCGQTAETGGDLNAFWAKLALDGTLIGAVKWFGSSQDDAFTRISSAENNRLLLSGWTEGFTSGAYDGVFTVSVDYDGNLKSAFTYHLEETNLTVHDMETLPGNQFVLALGSRTGSISPAILLKINGAGDQLFSYQYKSGGETDVFQQIKSTSTGLASVGLNAFNGDQNFYLVTTDLDGKFDNEDCCPMQVDLTRQEVSPEKDAFVPTQTAFFAAQSTSLSTANATSTALDICRSFELDFTISKDTICRGECVEIIDETITPGVNYTYEIQGGEVNPDSMGQVCHSNGGVLFITRRGVVGGCDKTLTKAISLGSKADDFPNAFTPNGDDANDVFQPVFGCPALSMNLKIFNRWGKLVFNSNDTLTGWDGKSEG